MIFKDVDVSTFDAEVVEASKNKSVMVFFTAPWCGPCRAIQLTLQELAEERKDDITVVKVDVDSAMPLAQKFSITVIPAFVLFTGGSFVAMRDSLSPQPETLIGAVSRRRIVEWLDENLHGCHRGQNFSGPASEIARDPG